MRKALIICNYQNDFCIDGAIPIKKSLDIIPIINRIRDKFDIVIFIKDWHPRDHSSFISHGGKWIEHCIQDRYGAEINSGVYVDKMDEIIHKGSLSLYDSYSAFYNAKTVLKETNLNNILKKNNVVDLYFCGLYFEVFIFSSVLDGVMFKYNCYVIDDLSLPKDEKNAVKSRDYLKNINVKFINSRDIK